MFNKNKYQGEVWLPHKKEKRFFCILTIKDNQGYLETNLIESNPYKIDLIRGDFNELGHLTFIDNTIHKSQSNLIVAKTYAPKYIFKGKHFINPQNLKLKNL